MSDSELTTKPTLETILDRINAQGDVMRAGFATIDKRLETVEKRLEPVEQRLEQIEIRLDRVQGIVLQVRADLREFRSSFKQPTLSS
jgi:tetrahydromethanopterin S-methyltransferase subunit G